MTSAFNIAVHGIIYLNHLQKNLCSDVLAANICTNPARVRKVMAQLKKAGLVETKEGADGGYQFTRPAHQVNLRMIYEAIDTCFVKTGWKSGSSDMQCMIASGMAGVMDDLYRQMDLACRQRLEQITIADLDDQIFNRPHHA